MRRLVDAYRDVTNHDHSANLAATVEHVRAVVDACVAALDSQQWCHNVQCAMWPEANLTYCETQATALVDRLVP